MNKNSKIYIAGHQGLVGSALLRYVSQQGYTNIVTRDFCALDLRNQETVNKFFQTERPEYVFLAAARVGGIKANATFPASFIYDNLMIQSHVIHAAHQYKVKKLLFLGSSCIYPRLCEQPIKEEYLLTGALEETNKAYAVAKIAGVTMCQSYRKQYGDAFICAMPTNLYGPDDNFEMEQSHAVPGLIARFHEAKITNQSIISVWGTGKARREFLYIDDLARVLVFLMQNYNDEMPINIGCGTDITIESLAALIKKIVGYNGEIRFEPNAPEGTPQKLLDISKMADLGLQVSIDLKEGLTRTYAWYQQNYHLLRTSYISSRPEMHE